MFNRLFGRKSVTKSNNTFVPTKAPPQPILQMMDSREFYAANKAMPFSQMAQDFISGGGFEDPNVYGSQAVLGAYLSSVYLFSALRKISQLVSRANIVAEKRVDNKWVRMPEATYINQLFDRERGDLLPRLYLNYAIYGSAVAVFTKSVKAINAMQAGDPIYRYDEGAIAGFYALDDPQWTLDEDTWRGVIKGIRINQSSEVLGDRHYLDRNEFMHITDWNPENPNKGRSLATVAIHEAVANASIARWMSEYFTRGAMPFILVALDEDPGLITDADLRSYKRQFEQSWQGMDASLRAQFMDRKVTVEQVGISADEVNAPDLNNTALEGISAVIGIDRELIVAPEGGTHSRHEIMMMRAILDVVIPFVDKVASSFTRDLGLPTNVRVVGDYSDYPELEANRDEKSQTELSIYESGGQTHQEMRQRLNMEPIKPLENWVYVNGEAMPITHVEQLSQMPPQALREYAMEMWESDLATRSQTLAMLGRTLPEDARDGFRSDLANGDEFLTSLWQDDLLTRGQILEMMNIKPPYDFIDGYRSEVEQSDNKDFIMQLWGDNLITRNMVLKMLGLPTIPGKLDGYLMDIENDQEADQNFIDTIMNMWGDDLITREQALVMLGVAPRPALTHGYRSEVEDYVDYVENLWGSNLLSRRQALKQLGVSPDNAVSHGYYDDIEYANEKANESLSDRINNVTDMYNEQFIQRSLAQNLLGVPVDTKIDGYQAEIEPIIEKRLEETGEGTETIQHDIPQQSILALMSGVAKVPPYDVNGSSNVSPSDDETWDRYYEQLGELEDKAAIDRVMYNRVYEIPYQSLEALVDMQPDTRYVSEWKEPKTYAEPGQIIEMEPDPNPDSESIPSTEEVLEETKAILPANAKGDSLSMLLWLPNQSQLMAIQDALKMQYDNPFITWNDPSLFHATIVYVDKVSESVAEAIANNSPDAMPYFELELDHLDTFENSDETPIIIRVKGADKFNQRFFAIVQAQGVKVSEYSLPGSYQPHITMGYAPPGFKLDDKRAFRITLNPEAIVIAQSDYSIVKYIPFNNNKPHDEPDGTNVVGDSIGHIEQRERLLYLMRNAMENQIIRWRDRNIVPSVMGRLQQAIVNSQAEDKWDVAIWGIRNGYFDPDSLSHYSGDDMLQLARKSSTKAKQKSPYSELNAWKKYTKRHGPIKAIRFETFLLSDEVRSMVLAGLEQADGRDDDLNPLFNNAKAATKAEEDSFELTPERLERWANRLSKQSMDDDLRKLVLVQGIETEDADSKED